MPAYVLPGAGFLVAVLWFDLMFDVQTRKHSGDTLPPEILTSIQGYYRRVTTEAWPMNRLVGAVMLLTLLAIAFEIAQGPQSWWVGWASLAATLSAVALAVARTVPNAGRLGTAAGTPQERTRLARAVYRDHLFCLAAMVAVVSLQLLAQF